MPFSQAGSMYYDALSTRVVCMFPDTRSILLTREVHPQAVQRVSGQHDVEQVLYEWASEYERYCACHRNIGRGDEHMRDGDTVTNVSYRERCKIRSSRHVASRPFPHNAYAH